MSSTYDHPSRRLQTEGIFRRALGAGDASPTGGTQAAGHGRAVHRDDGSYESRTEPTLDDRAMPADTEAPEPSLSSLPPVPPPQDDDPLPVVGRRDPLHVLRWAVGSLITVAVSIAIGVLLLLPGTTLQFTEASRFAGWLPAWTTEALARLSGKAIVRHDPLPVAAESALPPPATTPAQTSNSASKSASSSASNSESDSASAPAQTAPASSAAVAVREHQPTPSMMAADRSGSPRAGAEGTTSIATTGNPADGASAPTPTAATPTAAAIAPINPTTPAATPPKSDRQRLARADKGPAQPPTASVSKRTGKPLPSPTVVAGKSARLSGAKAIRAQQRDEQAIRTSSPRSIFVQYVALRTKADAQAWLARHRGLARTRVVAVKAPGKGLQYAVVSGPFASRKDATAFAARDGVASTPWLRPQPSLSAALPAERQ